MDRDFVFFLTGKKCDLAVMEREDARFMTKVFNNPEVRRNLAKRFPMNTAVVTEWIDDEYRKRNVTLLIIDKASGNPAGFLRLCDFNWPNQRAELSIAILPEFQGSGMGTEATKILIKYAFDNLGLRKITLEVYGFNDIAVKMYEKIGFIKEGHYKDHSLKDGQYHDLLFMTLHKDNFNN